MIQPFASTTTFLNLSTTVLITELLKELAHVLADARPRGVFCHSCPLSDASPKSLKEGDVHINIDEGTGQAAFTYVKARPSPASAERSARSL